MTDQELFKLESFYNQAKELYNKILLVQKNISSLENKDKNHAQNRFVLYYKLPNTGSYISPPPGLNNEQWEAMLLNQYKDILKKLQEQFRNLNISDVITK